MRFKPMIFCSLSVELVHGATRVELACRVFFFTHTKLFILDYSNRPNFKGNKHSLRLGVANYWLQPTHLNTLSKIEERESLLMLRTECLLFK